MKSTNRRKIAMITQGEACLHHRAEGGEMNYAEYLSQKGWQYDGEFWYEPDDRIRLDPYTEDQAYKEQKKIESGEREP